MSQLNDAKFDSLRAQGYSGAIDDMEKVWATDNQLQGATGTEWYQALIDAGITPAAINDMEFEFWLAGGTFSLKVIQGWTGLENCA